MNDILDNLFYKEKLGIGNKTTFIKKVRERHPKMKVKDRVLNKGFRYIDSSMKSYEQSKRGLSYVYHKRIVCDNGVTTKPLNI